MIDIGEIPELDRLARRFRVDPIEVALGREAAAGRDQQQRGRRDPRHGVLQRRAGRLSGEDSGGRVHRQVERRPFRLLAEVSIVGVGSAGRAVGDDGLQASVFGRDPDQGVGASRETEPADALGIDVRTLAQERERAGDVLRPAPAEPDRAAFALAAAAGVVDDDAEAVTGEEFRVRDRPGPVASSPVDDDRGRTVAGRVVPTGELEPVGGREGHGLVLRARRGADRLAVLVRLDDRQAGREDEGVERERPGEERDAPVDPAAAARARAFAAVSPGDPERERDQHDPAASASTPVTSLPPAHRRKG